jgi:hypothetical protein
VSVTGSPITGNGSLAISLDIDKLTETSAISAASDYFVVYHTSATAPRKVRPRNTSGYFVAHKNGTNQGSIANGVETKITFGTEDYDTVGVYDTATSRFVPPSGEAWLIHAHAETTDGADATFTVLAIYKNGALFRYGGANMVGGAAGTGPQATAVVVGNGSDYYEIYFSLSNSLSARTINGGTARTYFQGHRIG